MISDTDLRSWSKFLDLQIQILDSYIYAATGKTWAPSRADLALFRDAALSAKADSAVDCLVRTGDWPKRLEQREYRHLFHRAFHATGMFVTIAATEEALPAAIDPENPISPPDPADNGAFIRWLFVDLWKLFGPAYVETLAASSVPPQAKV